MPSSMSLFYFLAIPFILLISGCIHIPIHKQHMLPPCQIFLVTPHEHIQSTSLDTLLHLYIKTPTKMIPCKKSVFLVDENEKKVAIKIVSLKSHPVYEGYLHHVIIQSKSLLKPGVSYSIKHKNQTLLTFKAIEKVATINIDQPEALHIATQSQYCIRKLGDQETTLISVTPSNSTTLYSAEISIDELIKLIENYTSSESHEEFCVEYIPTDKQSARVFSITYPNRENHANINYIDINGNKISH